MTEWIVGNAWWVAPALTFAGVGMLVGALLWPRKAAVTDTTAGLRIGVGKPDSAASTHISQTISDVSVQHFAD